MGNSTAVTEQQVNTLFEAVQLLAANNKNDSTKLAVLENNHNHFINTLDTLTQQQASQNENFARLNTNLENIEKRTLKDIEELKTQAKEYPQLVKDLGNQFDASIGKLQETMQNGLDSLDERLEREIKCLNDKVVTIEQNQKVEAGKEEVRKDYRQFWAQNWHKLIMVGGTLVVVVASIYAATNGFSFPSKS